MSEIEKVTPQDKAAVAAALVFPTLITWVYFVLLAEQVAVIQQSAYSVGKVIQFGFPVAWVLAVQRQRLQFQRPAGRSLLEAGGFGIVVIVVTVGLYLAWLKPAGVLDAATGPIREKIAGLSLDSLTKYAALGLFYCVGHSLLEEYYWRWFVFRQLRRFVPLRPAIFVSAVGFMAHHVIIVSTFFGWFTIQSILFSLAVAGGGVIWAWLYERHKSIYGPWLCHALIDAGIFVIGYGIVKGNFSG